MISKTKISKRTTKKTNPSLIEAIYLAKKQKKLELAKVLASPRRIQPKVSIEQIANSGKTKIIIPGKILGGGNLKNKIEVYAWGFSESAKEKLEKSGSKFETILEALRNKKIEG